MCGKFNQVYIDSTYSCEKNPQYSLINVFEIINKFGFVKSNNNDLYKLIL